MDTHLSDRAPAAPARDQLQMFRNLRERNERRASRARELADQRQRHVERVMQIARQRRFRQRG